MLVPILYAVIPSLLILACFHCHLTSKAQVSHARQCDIPVASWQRRAEDHVFYFLIVVVTCAGQADIFYSFLSWRDETFQKLLV